MAMDRATMKVKIVMKKRLCSVSFVKAIVVKILLAYIMSLLLILILIQDICQMMGFEHCV